MTNEQMKAGRYLRWAKARKLAKAIREALQAGKVVTVTTYTRQVVYKAKHVDMFKASRTGLYVQRGKSWDCIDGCKINVWS